MGKAPAGAGKKSRVAQIRKIPPPLPLQMLRAREAVMQRFRPFLREHGLNDQQGRIIRVLAEAGELEMRELAAHTCMHAASLSRIIPRLEERGIIQRWKHEDDARRVIVAIAPEGRAFFKILSRHSERIYAELAAEIGTVRMRELYRCLDALIETGADNSTEDLDEAVSEIWTTGGRTSRAWP
jgi:homoprotocatechuate degradation regulator HpaR